MGVDLGTAGTAPIDGFWWQAKRDAAHEKVWPLVEYLRHQNSALREKTLRHINLYGNYDPFGHAGADVRADDRLRYNLIKQAVDSLQADVCSMTPKARYVTTRGDWRLQQTAKKREALIEGQLRDNGFYSGEERKWWKDAAIVGTGEVFGYADWETGEARLERALPLEVLVDQADGRTGHPRAKYRQRLIDREVLKAKFPGKRHLLTPAKLSRFAATSETDQWFIGRDTRADLVLLVEAWHLPVVEGGKGGRYVACVESATLHDAPYRWTDFPDVALRFSDRQAGYTGEGVAEMLRADQIELNKTLMRIQDTMEMSNFYVFLENNSRVRRAHVKNTPGQFINFTGTPPIFHSTNVVSQELFMHADRIIERALGRLGVSQGVSEGRRPGGLNSGEAIREYRDLGSSRQIIPSKAWDDAFAGPKSLARLLERVNRDLADGGKGAPVRVKAMRGRRTLVQTIDWKQSDLPENEYLLEPLPASALPSHPSGRLATVREWTEAGLIDAATAKRLVDFPDVDDAMSLDLADSDVVLYAVEVAIEDGKFVSPEPLQDLALSKELARKAYNRARVDGVPDERLELVRRYITSIERLQKKAEQAEQEAAAAMAPPAPPVDPALAGPLPAPEAAGIPPIPLSGAA
jgi:hypothetical protein